MKFITPSDLQSSIQKIFTYVKMKLDGKQDKLTVGANISISGGTISATDTTYKAATTTASGLMSADDKKKLDGVASGANKYSLPTASSSVLGGVKTGSNITNTSGTISLTKTNVTTALGYTPPTTNTTYGNATQTAAGLESAADKKNIDLFASLGLYLDADGDIAQKD